MRIDTNGRIRRLVGLVFGAISAGGFTFGWVAPLGLLVPLHAASAAEVTFIEFQNPPALIAPKITFEERRMLGVW